jgi:hypothetical protein
MANELIPTGNRTWAEAFRLFMKAEGMGVASKIILRFIPAAYIPFGLLNDATIIGAIDDPLTIGFAIYVLWRINKYRTQR